MEDPYNLTAAVVNTKHARPSLKLNVANAITSGINQNSH